MRPHANRLRDLLVERAIYGLSEGSERELTRLQGPDDGADPDGYELAAATVRLAFLAQTEPLPREIRRRVEQKARENLDPEQRPSHE